MEQPLHLLDILSAVALLAFMTWIGTRGAKTQTEEDFLIGGRAIPDWALAGTIAAGIIGGGVLLIFPEYVFRFGFSAFCIIAGIVLGTVLIVPIALRFKTLADRQSFYTLPDLYAFDWGRKAGLLATITVGLWTVGFIIMQLISAGKVLQHMTGWPYSAGVIVAAVTVASYLLVSGFRAVVITDVLQYSALLLLLLIVLPTASTQISLRDAVHAFTSEHIEWGEGVGFFLLGCLNMVVSADLWQRVYAARSPRDARRGLIFAAILVLVAGILLMVPPLYARIYMPTVEPKVALIESLIHLVPRWLFSFALVGVLSTVVATLDTMVFILGISIGHDLQVRQRGGIVANRVRYTRHAIVWSLVVGCIGSIAFPNLLQTGLALSSLGLVLAPSILMRLTPWKPSTLAVELGLALGLLTAVVLIACARLTPENALIALVASVVGTLIGTLLSWRRRK